MRRMRFFVVGGAGFIGSHLVDLLVERGPGDGLDNLSVGKTEFIAAHLASRAARSSSRATPSTCRALTAAMKGHDVVFHLAANPEARWGLERTRLDLEQGTIATYNALEAARLDGVKRFVFSSSGTVYGNVAEPVRRDRPRAPAHLALRREQVRGRGAGRGVRRVLRARGVHLPLRQRRRPARHARRHPRLLQEAQGAPRVPRRARRRPAGKPYLHVTDCAAGLLYVLDHAARAARRLQPRAPRLDERQAHRRAVRRRVAEPEGAHRVRRRRAGLAGRRAALALVPDKLAALGFRVRYTSDQAVEMAVKQSRGRSVGG